MKLLLNFLCSLLFLCQELNAGASSAKPEPSLISNMRLGIGIAGEYATVDSNLEVRPAESLGVNTSSSQQQACKKFQVAPSVELGATIMNNYYLGFLVSWHYSNAKTKASQSPLKGNYYFSHQFQLKSYINAFIKPGYRLTSKAMMYGVIGPSIANWSHTTDEFRINNLTNVISLTDTFKLEKRTIGLGLGCGFEYLLKRKWALSFEYVSYIHRSTSASKQISYIERVAGVNASRTGDLVKIVKPSHSTFVVRLTRFFSLF